MYGPSHNITIGQLQLRINWLLFACVVITIFTFLRLGFWQLGRASEKLATQEAFDAQQMTNAIAIEIVASNHDLRDIETLQNLHVRLQGEYLNERTILLTAQFFDGQIGYEVVTPFQLLQDGPLVLVSRGWTSGILPPNTPPYLGPVDGLQELTAQVHIPDPDQPVYSSQIDASRWPLQTRSLEMHIMEDILGQPLFPYVVRLTEQQPGVLVRHWPETNADINNNLSYAVQWFSFALIVAVVSLLASTNLIKLFRD